MNTSLAPRSLTGLVLALVLLLGITAPAAAADMPYPFLDQLGGASYAIATLETVVCVGVGPNLTVLSASDLAPLGNIRLPAIVRGLATADGYAYVAAGAAGLRIVSLVNPAAPVEVGSMPMEAPGSANGVAVAGTYAYVAAAEGGVVVVDVSDPTDPVR
ncbi:MAG: hypothetical protein JSW37_11665, partial [Anaerolineales bacterium]